MRIKRKNTTQACDLAEVMFLDYFVFGKKCGSYSSSAAFITLLNSNPLFGQDKAFYGTK